eukprot:9627684-Ditylum_brightwellii.AAC.1
MGPGLAYEIALPIYCDKICWVSGPFPAGQNDVHIFQRPNGLMSKIPDNKHVIADEGYVVVPTKASTRNPFDSDELKDFKRRTKARQETINKRLKSFGILSQTFCST